MAQPNCIPLPIRNGDFMARRLAQLSPIGAKMGYQYAPHAPMYYVSTISMAEQRFTRIERRDMSGNLMLVGHLTGDLDNDTATRIAHILDHHFEEGWVA